MEFINVQKWTYYFIKHSQNVCLISTHILIHWHVRCDCKLWNAFRFDSIFLGIFIYYWWSLMSNFYRLCIPSIHTLWYIDMPDVTVSYGMYLDFIAFLGYLSSKYMFPLFFKHLEKKVLDPNGPYISTFQTNLRNVCLSVILESCLSSSS